MVIDILGGALVVLVFFGVFIGIVSTMILLATTEVPTMSIAPPRAR